jgi:intracellular sulfur oxidation DsrE/DsrF family protein
MAGRFDHAAAGMVSLHFNSRSLVMKRNEWRLLLSMGAILSLVLFLALSAGMATAGEYADALKDVKGVRAVFDVSLGSAMAANVIFGAVRNSYQDKTVQALPEKPKVAVVFHGPAVKIISTDRAGYAEDAGEEVDKFHGLIRQLKKDGVKLEVCLYAARALGVDPATILPEIDRVGNGFISVIGYQAQGYSVVRIP